MWYTDGKVAMMIGVRQLDSMYEVGIKEEEDTKNGRMR